MPRTRHFTNWGLDQRGTTIAKRAAKGGRELLRAVHASVPNSERLREQIKLRVIQLVGERVAELLTLQRAHVAEQAIVEHHDHDVQPVACCSRQFCQSPTEAAITCDAHDRSLWVADRGSECCRK